MIALSSPPPSMSDPNMSMLWSMLAELSSTLSTNRELTARLFRLAESVGDSSTAIAAAASAPNGLEELQKSLEHANETKQSNLESENEQLRKELLAFRSERDDLDVLTQQYDLTVSRIMDGLREYTLTRAESVIEIHKSYAAKIEEEQRRYDELHKLYAEQEQHIRKLSESLRLAYRFNDVDSEIPATSATASGDSKESTLSVTEILYALQTENEGLKRIMGLRNNP
ncbi:hypothetical protein BZA70DRAFT_271581 [Myxozyma melibiosi]|uniref:Uncharacterized protein n=1 Tax=Myxozyma melibiosi TaxID=54550 RepID=A0ABR1FCG8_9ASCO